jgi:two-component system chemotaxis sensor kinase CheA
VKFTFEADDLEILQGIFEESTEHLKGIEGDILKLEADFAPELVDSVFRALHSIKGVASFVDLVPLRDTAHCLESLMTDLRKGLYSAGIEVTDILLQGVDILNLLINQLGTEVQNLESDSSAATFDITIPDYGYTEFIEEVTALRTRLAAENQKTSPEMVEEKSPPKPESGLESGKLELSALFEQMRAEFIEETTEHLYIIEQNCIALEKHPHDPELLNAILRGFHSIKGGAGVVASIQNEDNPRDPISLIRALTHSAESLLQTFRQGTQEPPADMVDLILQAVDRLTILTGLVKENREADFTLDKLIEQIESLSSGLAESSETKKDQPAPNQSKVASKLAAFSNITNQALDSMESLLNSVRENHPVHQKRFKQYIRALKNLQSSAIYLEYDDIVSCVTEQLHRLETFSPEENLVSQPLLDFLHKSFTDLKDMLETRIAAVQQTVESTPGDYADKKLGEILVSEDKLKPEDLDQALKQQKKLGQILVDNDMASAEDVKEALSKQALAREKRRQIPDTAGRPAAITSQSIRVSQEKLDRLVNAISELLVSKNRILHLANNVSLEYNLPSLSREMNEMAAEVSRISDELQDAIMSARMVPLRTLFQRFPRTIRDASRKAGKMVELKVEGEETELDKTVVEAINDPLVHMLRNAVDHGIETPEARGSLDKDPRGTIHLRAYYQGSSVVIEISDDGRGLNPDEIKLNALKKGLITTDQIESLNNQEACQLIFAPGFSTRDEVTELSGRGVGMDVVKSNIERVGGSITLQSAVNVGTTFTLQIPLSMSIIQGLMVEAGGQPYIIGFDSIEETVKLPPTAIRRYQDNQVADIRGQILPLMPLHELLRIEPVPDSNHEKQLDDRLSIVVAPIDGMRVGLIVDHFKNQQEFVIKSLTEELAALKIYTGATILGDGSVVLILNLNQLLRQYLSEQIGG